MMVREDYVYGGVIGALVLLLVALFVGLYYVTAAEQREWQAFAAAHDCKLVRVVKAKSRVVTTFGTDGKMHTGSVSDGGQKCYACDDGVEYCR